MNLYETIYIIKPDVEEEAVKAIVEKFKALVEVNGEFETIDDWGKRKLAYPINDENEGYYVLANYSAESDFPRELERNFKITEGILKYIIIRKD